MPNTREKPVCTKCGGDSIKRDAWAVWNEEEQDWEISSTYDDMWCDDCEDTASVNWVNI